MANNSKVDFKFKHGDCVYYIFDDEYYGEIEIDEKQIFSGIKIEKFLNKNINSKINSLVKKNVVNNFVLYYNVLSNKNDKKKKQ